MTKEPKFPDTYRGHAARCAWYAQSSRRVWNKFIIAGLLISIASSLASMALPFPQRLITLTISTSVLWRSLNLRNVRDGRIKEFLELRQQWLDFAKEYNEP